MTKHNKKRNPVFLFNILVREFVETKEKERKKEITSCIMNFFNKKRELHKEYRLYKQILNVQGEPEKICQGILNEVKQQYSYLDHKKLFKEKTDLLNFINKKIGKQVYSKFVPNYKNIASIYQIFNKTGSIKNNVILETKIIEEMKQKETSNNFENKIDGVVVGKFLQKYNQTYSNTLLENQKKLIKEYIFSFSDNSLSLKSFLNEEIDTLKKELLNVLEDKELCSDDTIKKQTNSAYKMLQEMHKQKIDENLITTIMKFYNLANIIKETQENFEYKEHEDKN